jgi:predicted amidohydrolase
MIKKAISFLIFCVFVWLIWSFSGRNHPLPSTDALITEIHEINPSDSLDRSLVGIQPYMLATDYFSQAMFKEKMGIYLREAKKRNLIRTKSIVLFPEYIGTWLVLEGEKHSIAEEATLKDALTIMVASNFFEFGTSILKVGGAKDKAAAAIFRMKARKMAKSYFSTFSELAEEYNTYIAAGSIILPGPGVENGNLVLDIGKPLYNASFIFGPDGKIIGSPILKAFPIESEQPFLSASDPIQIPAFDLPIGKTSLLICADSWYPEAYQTARQEKAEIILVPSYCTGNGTMDLLWKGYSGYPEPQGTELSDINKITERQAWEKYALPGKIKTTSAQVGMNVFLRGELWDLGTDGQPLVVKNGELLPVNPAEKAGIWSLNF